MFLCLKVSFTRRLSLVLWYSIVPEGDRAGIRVDSAGLFTKLDQPCLGLQDVKRVLKHSFA